MVKIKTILAVSVMIALAGCGGSGTGGNSGVVTPTPAPTPTPTPAPTNTTLANLVASQVFPIASASTVARFGGSFNQPAGQFQAYNAGPLTFTYEQPAGSYHLNISANPPRFGPTAAATTSNFQTFGAVDGVGSRLIVFRPGSTNTMSALSFVSYGLFRSNETVSSSAADLTYRNFIYGLPTAAADVPRTGTATYTTTTDGVWIKTNRDFFDAQISGLQEIRITGVSTTTVNFAANTLTFTLTLTGPDRDTGRTLTIASLTGTGTIAASGVITGTVTGGTYSYTFIDAADPFRVEQRVTYGFSGPFSGSFFGPSGAEVGLAFQLAPDSAPNRAASVSGVIVGKR